MALANGNEVAYLQAAANADFAERNGDFVFGVVSDATGVDVLWSNGTFTADIPAAALDQILPDTSGSTLVGRVVKITNADSGEYYALLVRQYSRNPAGAGSSTAYALVQVKSTGRLFEVLATELTPVTGQ